MKKSYIKIIGFENKSRSTRVSFEPTALIPLRDKIFTHDKSTFERIEISRITNAVH